MYVELVLRIKREGKSGCLEIYRLDLMGFGSILDSSIIGNDTVYWMEGKES